jgi:hypothetical protein
MHSLCFIHKDMVRLDCKQLEQQEAALRQFQSIISAKVKDMEGMNKEYPLEIQQIRKMWLSKLNKCVCDEDKNI